MDETISAFWAETVIRKFQSKSNVSVEMLMLSILLHTTFELFFSGGVSGGRHWHQYAATNSRTSELCSRTT